MDFAAEYWEISEVVDLAKEMCDIATPNDEMLDAEIREVCRWIGEDTRDVTWTEGKPVFGGLAIGVMLLVSLMAFPEFYSRYELSPSSIN